MAILGVGIDIVDVNRIRKMAEEHGERFLKRVFSDEELAYCFRFSIRFPIWRRGGQRRKPSQKR